MCLPIVVQLLHSVQALPDSSDKLGLVSVTFQTKRRHTGLASAKKTAAKMKLEVILQSTFSRTVILRVNKNERTHSAITSQQVTLTFYS